MDDLNKFESLGHKAEGCATGQHLWDEREGHSTVETDGDLTKIKMKCVVCGRQFDISAPLGLNDFINNQSVHTTPQAPQIQKIEPPTTNEIEQSDILRRILG